jgi:integrase/recombinase XerD
MSNRTATLYLRVTTKNGKTRFCKPVYLSKGRLKPHAALVNREPQHHPEGVYYIRFGRVGRKQRFESVGNDPYVALDKLAEKERWLRDRERGIPYAASDSPKPESSRLRVDGAVEQYFKNLQSQGKDPKTIRAYRLAMNEFRQSCTKKFVDEIRKQDLIDFMGWLRTRLPKLRKDGQPRKPRRSGDPNRTYFNKVNDIVIFLSAHGINRLLKKSEYPKFAEKPVVYYDSEQVKALYAAAKDSEERFTLDYFLKSGVRDGEAAHAEYSDVKGGFLNIVDKPHLNWHPKHWHIRRIPIPLDLIAAIAERQRQNPGCKLIFPNKGGKPDQHLLRIVQRIAKRAGGTFHADLHTFRRTYATLFSGTTKIQTIQYLLGHKDIKTTMRYLGIPDLNSPETRRAVEETFREFTATQIDTTPVATASVM